MDDGLWAEWSRNKCGDAIGESDFFAPGGLLEWVRAHQHELEAARARGLAPVLEEEAIEAWLKHWDRSKRGIFTRGELLRALCESANVSSLEVKRIKQLKDGLQLIWEHHANGNSITHDHVLKSKAGEELVKVASEVRATGDNSSDVGLA